MVDTHVSPKKTRNKLQGKLRRRTRNGNYSYRLTSSNGSRKEFTLQTRNYDEAVLKASELDSIWLAPTKEVALAQMNAMRGFSSTEQDASFDEAWEIYKTHPNRATPRTVEEQIGYRRTFRDAQHRLGLCYLIGLGVTPREEEAVYWLQKAADQGHKGAQKSLGDLYYNKVERQGFSSDEGMSNLSKALKWYQQDRAEREIWKCQLWLPKDLPLHLQIVPASASEIEF